MDRRCRDSGLSAYLDGELDAEDAAQVERHLEQCAKCRARLRALERIAATLRQVGRSAPPSPRSVAAPQPVRVRHRAAIWQWAVAGALGLAVIVGVHAGVSRRPAAASEPVAKVRATVDFRSNQVVTLISWRAHDREPGR